MVPRRWLFDTGFAEADAASMAKRCGFVFLRPRIEQNTNEVPYAHSVGAAASADDVARRAYEIYEGEGRPQGRQLQHWTQAQRELSQQA